MAHKVLSYRTENTAKRAMARLLKRHPVHGDCKVRVVYSPSWLFPFRYLIEVRGIDGRISYWSRAR